ncbi:hypothetical protein TNCV_3158301 [Trichonephila clavipes]|nr:hypothetical protein TNCV_3158301 [Trichonephila clavipes]
MMVMNSPGYVSHQSTNGIFFLLNRRKPILDCCSASSLSDLTRARGFRKDSASSVDSPHYHHTNPWRASGVVIL